MGLVRGKYGRKDRFVEGFGGKLGSDDFEVLHVDGAIGPTVRRVKNNRIINP